MEQFPVARVEDFLSHGKIILSAWLGRICQQHGLVMNPYRLIYRAIQKMQVNLFKHLEEAVEHMDQSSPLTLFKGIVIMTSHLKDIGKVRI